MFIDDVSNTISPILFPLLHSNGLIIYSLSIKEGFFFLIRIRGYLADDVN